MNVIFVRLSRGSKESVFSVPELCDALEKAEGKLDYLHEEIGSVRAQLHTATFSTNKGAADMAKFILALLPAPPEEGAEHERD